MFQTQTTIFGADKLKNEMVAIEQTKARTANSTYKKLAVQWLNEALCFVSSSMVADSFRLRNRQLLVAAKRYMYNCRSPEISKQPFFLVSHAQTKLRE
jgi:hypothetical protein